MAKTQSLHSDDLVVSAPQNKSATRQRGVTPSAELIPMQFRMPPEFVQAFKQEALNRKMKLNEFMKTCFDVFMKNPEQ
jgi:hypothetical protein